MTFFSFIFYLISIGKCKDLIFSLFGSDWFSPKHILKAVSFKISSHASS